MIKHRLIEDMLKVIQRTLEHAAKTQEIDPLFVDTAVDFIRVHADHIQHAKEEDILFREFQKKPLTDKDRQLMRLIADQLFGCSTTKAILEANTRYRKRGT
jgi:hemerythrin-like domain-containing protein